MSTQIVKPLPGKREGFEWAGDEAEMENWEDDIEENGTDYSGGKVKKSFRMYSQLIHDDDLLKGMYKAEEEEANMTMVLFELQLNQTHHQLINKEKTTWQI